MRTIFTLTILLFCAQLGAQEWELLAEPNKSQKIDPSLKVDAFYIPKGSDEIHVKQTYEGSAFPYLTNKNWPKLKDFDFSFHFKYTVPEGAKCRETPMFRLLAHANGKTYHHFYRGYHYTNISEAVGRKPYLLMNSKILPLEKAIWYGVRFASKGKILKGKFWTVSEGEPKRWSIEGEAYEEPKAGQIAFAYRAWKDQIGTEIIFKNFKVSELKDETFDYLAADTRPERTTDSEIGRKHVGYPYEYYSAKDCKWPNHEFVRTEDWSTVLDKISVPEGWEKPTVKDGKLVLQVPAKDAADENNVAWFSSIIGIKVLAKFEIHCSEGLTPLLWYQNKDAKKKTEAWDGPKGYFDPFAQKDLATVFSINEGRIAAYGTNHLLTGDKYKFTLRFRNGVAMWYGSPDDVCDILEPGIPSVPWNGKPRIGFSAKGKAGTITITPISYSK